MSRTWRRALATLALGVAMALCLLAGLDDLLDGVGVGYAANPKTKEKPPALKVISVHPVPLPFIVPPETPLTLTIMVEIPKTLPEEALLDVTTLITSPSKFSIRLLTNRQMITGKRPLEENEADGDSHLVEVIQTWDGTDHAKRIVADGTYDYQVQAKLMVMGKNGPLTRATSWRKRGSFEVRAR